ncbi:MAG: hypothetical protein ACI9TA_003164 [Reinekea sp.]|jgi:hypothetical protein
MTAIGDLTDFALVTLKPKGCEMQIFSLGDLLWSSNKTRRPRRPAVLQIGRLSMRNLQDRSIELLPFVYLYALGGHSIPSFGNFRRH